MATAGASQQGMMWLTFSLMTVASWGVYGVLLHTGQAAMSSGPSDSSARYKAFLFVGVAYFITAVIAPVVILLVKGVEWKFSGGGMTWSLLAGIVGAVGAFCVLLAFGAGGKPPVVMSIIFAGAPIVNAFVAMLWHPPEGGVRTLPLPFLLGIVLAAVGGCLVALYNPGPGKPPPAKQAPAEPGTPSQEKSTRTYEREH